MLRTQVKFLVFIWHLPTILGELISSSGFGWAPGTHIDIHTGAHTYMH